MLNFREGKTAELGRLFELWKVEHRGLDEFVRSNGDWLHQQALVRAASYQDAAARLRTLADRLRDHFTSEEGLAKLLADVRGETTREIESIRRQADHEHATLLHRLEGLIDQLHEPSAAPDRWEAAIYEFNLFVDLLEQHEEQEAARIGWLFPQ